VWQWRSKASARKIRAGLGFMSVNDRPKRARPWSPKLGHRADLRDLSFQQPTVVPVLCC